ARLVSPERQAFSARRAFRLPAYSARLLGVRHAAADIHEAAPLDALGLLAARSMRREARAGRDEPADDDVLLEAAQVVLETANRRLREDAGGLLERGRGDERLRRERRLGDAEQHRLQSGGLLAVLLRAIVDVERAGPVELLTAQERRLARSLHLGLAQHLTDDHLDVLVVDLHTLQAIDVLDLAHEIVRQRLDALQTQDVVRVRLAVGDHFTTLDGLTLEDVELAPLRNQLLVLLAVIAGDDQTPLALGLLTEADGTRLLREDGRILGLARLEQIRHARQTARDVAGLRRLLRDAGDDVAHRYPRAVLEGHKSARGQRIHRRNLRVGEGHFLTLVVDQLDGRPQVLAATLLGVEHHGAGEPRDLVHLRRDGEAVDEVLELHQACDLGHHRVGVRIPGRHDLACRHVIAFLDADHRAVRNLVTLALTAKVIDQAALAGAGHGHEMTLLVLNGLDVVEADEALVAYLDVARRSGPGGGAADVEGTHRE